MCVGGGGWQININSVTLSATESDTKIMLEWKDKTTETTIFSLKLICAYSWHTQSFEQITSIKRIRPRHDL